MLPAIYGGDSQNNILYTPYFGLRAGMVNDRVKPNTLILKEK
jgi:hypothetical protein